MRHEVASPTDTSIARFNEDLPRIAHAYQRIADHAKLYDIITSVENHGYYVHASDRVQSLIHAVNRPNFKTTLDVGNFVCVDDYKSLGIRYTLTHISSIQILIHIYDLLAK